MGTSFEAGLRREVDTPPGRDDILVEEDNLTRESFKIAVSEHHPFGSTFPLLLGRGEVAEPIAPFGDFGRDEPSQLGCTSLRPNHSVDLLDQTVVALLDVEVHQVLGSQRHELIVRDHQAAVEETVGVLARREFSMRASRVSVVNPKRALFLVGFDPPLLVSIHDLVPFKVQVTL